MAILNIDALMRDVPRNRLRLVGVELEGGWYALPKGVDELEHDGSVAINRLQGEQPFIAGELPSESMLPAKMPVWMKKNYPQRVNSTCGMHVHMSFFDLAHYSCLMTPDYQDTVVEYLSRWAKAEGIAANHWLWPRLRGENRFCRLEFWADRQALAENKDHNQDREGHRYTAINFCFRQHETIECRILPMFEDVEVAIKAIKALFDITNCCVVVLGKKKESREQVRDHVNMPDNERYIEVMEEYI